MSLIFFVISYGLNFYAIKLQNIDIGEVEATYFIDAQFLLENPLYLLAFILKKKWCLYFLTLAYSLSMLAIFMGGSLDILPSFYVKAFWYSLTHALETLEIGFVINLALFIWWKRQFIRQNFSGVPSSS